MSSNARFKCFRCTASSGGAATFWSIHSRVAFAASANALTVSVVTPPNSTTPSSCNSSSWCNAS
eukprot:5950048-Lingulodinium_polyedra.AAC.1